MSDLNSAQEVPVRASVTAGTQQAGAQQTVPASRACPIPLFARAHTLEPVPGQRVMLLLPARIRVHTGHRIRNHVPEITECALPGSHARAEQLRDGGYWLYVRADLKRLFEESLQSACLRAVTTGDQASLTNPRLFHFLKEEHQCAHEHWELLARHDRQAPRRGQSSAQALA